MEVERKDVHKGESSKPDNGNDVWKACWSLQVTNTVKMFLWRACHNLLPTKANLVRRKVVENALCPICHREEETVVHLLWECASASDIWSGSSITLEKSPNAGMDFCHLFASILSRCDATKVALLAVTATRIWLRRNDVVHGGLFTHPLQVLREAKQALEDFQGVSDGQGGIARQPSEHIPAIWRPPPVSMIKINWDAALNKNTGIVGLGIIARDDRGGFLAACGIKKKLSLFPAGGS